MIERMRLPAVLYALAWALVAVEPSLWPVPLLGFAQNLAHTFVSRGRNSGSLTYHVIASIFSNGIYVSLLVLSISIVGYMQASGIPIFIAVFVLSTMSGSVTAHILALRLEKGKARNVQEDRVAGLAEQLRVLENHVANFTDDNLRGLAEVVQSAKMGLLALDEHERRLKKLEADRDHMDAALVVASQTRGDLIERVQELEARPVFVFGWVTPQDALAAIATEHGEEEVRRWAVDCGVKIEHGYGRWNVSANWSDWDQCFERVEGPGRGRFKVTYVTFGR
jgi:hypothetical protein